MPVQSPARTSWLDSPIQPAVSTSLLDSLITPATLAERLGLTQRGLSEKRITGTGPAFMRIGKSVRYRPEAVDAWLLAREFRSTSEEAR
ncbi:helix-turn-helix transcriptional regulator [Glaciibacter sp. 2TAF33]|uniref:helix-turn-helix transcriptional regulator n=1 Tax=Glaciibacter sp. 2TAF33 TaxID=3233015 RepID=UPI003F93B321